MNIFLKIFPLFTLLVFILSAFSLVSKKFHKLLPAGLLTSCLIGLLALLVRWWQAGQLEVTLLSSRGLLEPGTFNWLKTMLSHPPCTNLFEVLISLSWALIITAIILEKRYQLTIFAPLACGTAMLCQGAAFWALDATIDPLAPVLRSWWLHLHVAVAAFSYAAAMAAALIAFLYLLRTKIPRWQLITVILILALFGPFAFFNGRAPWNLIFLIAALCVMAVIAISLIFYNKLSNLSIESEKLDKLENHLVTITFITLTLVLVTGSVWAHYSWGRFWSWDPKETWSLVAWLCYGVYLHLLHQQNIHGKPLAYLAILSIMVVLFAFLGVNLGLSGPGMHTYGAG